MAANSRCWWRNSRLRLNRALPIAVGDLQLTICQLHVAIEHQVWVGGDGRRRCGWHQHQSTGQQDAAARQGRVVGDVRRHQAVDGGQLEPALAVAELAHGHGLQRVAKTGLGEAKPVERGA